MRKLIMTLALLLIPVASFSLGGPSIKPQSNTEEPQSVSFCELFNTRNSFLGKLVRIKVTWRSGHAFSDIDDPACEKRPSAWITFDKEDNLCDETQNKLTGLNKEFYNETEIVAVGRLQSCKGGCGHSSAYDYKFVVTCLEQAIPIIINKP